MATATYRLRTFVRYLAARSPLAGRVVGVLLRARDRVRPALDNARRPSLADPLAPYGQLLPEPAPRVVAVLAHAALRDRIRPWLEQFTQDDVHLVAADHAPDWQALSPTPTFHRAERLGQAHDVLKELGPLDAILDLRSDPNADRRATWQRLFLHLRAGGAYVLGQTDPERTGFDGPTRTWVGGLLDADAPDAAASFGAREYAAAVSRVVVARDVVIIGKQLSHLLKLRDEEANRLLPLRDPDLGMREMAALPAGEFESRARVTMYVADVPVEPMPERISHPTMHLRHFEGRLAYAGATLLHTENSILPESFRWHLAANPSNPKTVNSSPSFARIASDLRPTATLKGNFFMVDPNYGGYGHIMTEMVGRLWGWDQAKAQYPDLKAIFSVVRRKDTKPQPKHRILRAYGIAEQDIVWIDRPVYLTSLISPTSMWHNHAPYYVHPELPAVWDRLRTSLMDADAPSFERIFVSRTQRFSRRTCRNAEQLEQIFVRRGFTIVYPEQLDLSAQVKIFAEAKVIAGFGGSGLFNMMFAQRLESMIILNHDSYQHRNEHLYTSLLGCDVHYFWSTADIPQPGKSSSLAATESDWEFDFERYGKALAEVLDAL